MKHSARALATALTVSALASLTAPTPAAQQPTPAAAPTAAATAAPATPRAGLPKLPPNFDPCGGPQELLNKFGTTPCVVPRGEAMLSAGYTSAKVTGNATLGSLGTLAFSGLARQFPQALLTVGVTPQSDLEIQLPSYLRADTTREPWLAQGATDTSIEYKQRVAFDPIADTMTAVTLQVKLNTGSPSLRAASPAYVLGGLESKSWAQEHVTFIGGVDAAYGPTMGPMPVQRLSATVSALGLWTSPGSFLASAGAVYSSANGTVMPLFAVEQLVNPHVGVQVFYLGMGSGFAQTTELGLPMIQAINSKGNVNVVGANLIWLAGHGGPSPASLMQQHPLFRSNP
jgi:hypothetical protein